MSQCERKDFNVDLFQHIAPACSDSEACVSHDYASESEVEGDLDAV